MIPERFQCLGEMCSRRAVTAAVRFRLRGHFLAVPTSTPHMSSRIQQSSRKDSSMEVSIGFPQCFSPKRKPTAPKRRSLGAPLEMFTSPPTLDPGSTKKAIDELVQTQLAEKIAESINEVTTVMRPPPPAEDTCPSLLSCGSNLPDSVLSDVICESVSPDLFIPLLPYLLWPFVKASIMRSDVSVPFSKNLI